jgi:NADH dehydrogenase
MMRVLPLLTLTTLGATLIGLAWRAARQRQAPSRPAHVSESEEEFRHARQRVVILGAGFGGLATAMALDRELRDEDGVSVLVVDRNNGSLFNPLLWTVADGRASPTDVVVPIRDYQRGRRFHLLQAGVRAIDLTQREVQLDVGRRPYDYLVIALGSVTEFPSLPGIERVLPFRTPGDALSLRDHLIDAVEAAHRATSDVERRAWLTFVVVGGGDTGVELAGAIHGYLAAGLLAEYPWLSADDGRPGYRVVLVGRAPQLIPMGDPAESAATRQILERQGIEVQTGTAVESIRPGVVVTSRGEIPARTVFWAAGITAPSVLRELPVAHEKGGVLVVDDHLRLPSHPEVFVVGDATWAFDASGRPVPPTAQAAEHAGAYAGRAIATALRGAAPARPFRYRPLGHLLLLGPSEALARVGPLQFSGRLAWLLWHAYYLYRVSSGKRRLGLVGSWLLAMIYGREVAELRVGPSRPALAAARPAVHRTDPPAAST